MLTWMRSEVYFEDGNEQERLFHQQKTELMTFIELNEKLHAAHDAVKYMPIYVDIYKNYT